LIEVGPNALEKAQYFPCEPLPRENYQAEELQMNKLVSRFVRDESGATAIEYGLIAAGISVAIIAVVQGLGTNLKNTFQSVSTALK
jgi:pilus assembly protein Flp/PilA